MNANFNGAEGVTFPPSSDTVKTDELKECINNHVNITYL